jgi:hypothetical protein
MIKVLTTHLTAAECEAKTAIKLFDILLYFIMPLSFFLVLSYILWIAISLLYFFIRMSQDAITVLTFC